MLWDDDRKGSRKATVYVGFDLNQLISMKVLLGSAGINQSRLVGYEVGRVKYWIATHRYDLSTEQLVQAYKLRWNKENFFALWKMNLNVDHLIARSSYGLMVRILAGLITYLLLPVAPENQQYEKEQNLQNVKAKT